jgi:hypothetical protein
LITILSVPERRLQFCCAVESLPGPASKFVRLGTPAEFGIYRKFLSPTAASDAEASHKLY